MHGVLKPKKFGSATLEQSWPKPVFPYKGSVGHHPVEAQPYVFVSRHDKKTGRHIVVPEMFYPLQAGRQPVPKHLLLEDEYRAFHAIVISGANIRKHYFPEVDPREPLTSRKVVDLKPVVMSSKVHDIKNELPLLLAYKPGMAPPPGFMYRSYKKIKKQQAADLRSQYDIETTGPPVCSIRGPFQNMVNWSPPPFSENIKLFDAAVISCPPKQMDVQIYNEPGSVSSQAVTSNFWKPLHIRAKPGEQQYKEAFRDIENIPKGRTASKSRNSSLKLRLKN